MAVSKGTQDLIDQAVAEAVKQAQVGLTTAASKPHLVEDLRKTWRGSAEHKAAQVKRFVYSLGSIVGLQLVSDWSTGTNPMTHFTDAHTAWYYLLPFALVAWKQVHPSMSASEVDSAPGVTIVPSQVGAQAVDVPVDNASVEVALPDGTSPSAAADVAAGVEGDAAP